MKKLSIVLADRPHTRPLRDGRVSSELLELEFVEYEPVAGAFDAMVRDQAFDVSEMAMVAFMQGRADGAPIALLPIVVFGGFHHASLRRRPERAVTPADLPGQTLAVRAYSQTTGLWVRALLAQQYEVELDRLSWLVTEGSHSDAYVDPANVTRAPQGRTLDEMLRAGEAIASVQAPAQAPGTEPVIADPQAGEDGWFAATRIVPINHMVCVTEAVAGDQQTTRELYRMLREAHELVLGPQDRRELRPGIPSPVREGRERIDPALELGARHAAAQGLIAAVPPLDELFVGYLS
jgi:4,5-dihydroxyphthalate decarboxylase